MHGDFLLDILIDANLCVVNGRKGKESNNFTHISHRGKSVVDYVIVPHDQLSYCSNFAVMAVSEIINTLGLHGFSKLPDHSVL